jgi:hypothetical protein
LNFVEKTARVEKRWNLGALGFRSVLQAGGGCWRRRRGSCGVLWGRFSVRWRLLWAFGQPASLLALWALWWPRRLLADPGGTKEGPTNAGPGGIVCGRRRARSPLLEDCLDDCQKEVEQENKRHPKEHKEQGGEYVAGDDIQRKKDEKKRQY